MTWDNKESEASRGKLYKLSALNKSDHYFKRAQEKRVELIETLAMVNNRYFYFDLKSFVSRLIDILT